LRVAGILAQNGVGFVASRGNTAHHNWVHGNRSAQDMDLTSRAGPLEPLGLKRIFLGRRNRIYDNTFYDEIPDTFPDEAQDVIDNAGLQPEFAHIRDYLAIE
jgi:hypothetical protein